MGDEKKTLEPCEIILKLAAMSPEEFNQFMAWNFSRVCQRPLPPEDSEP